MALYTCLLIFFSLLSFFEVQEVGFFTKTKVKLNIMYFSCLILLVLGTIRWEVGGDWYSYKEIFDYSFMGLEIGYSLINLIIKRITDNYSVLLFVFSLIFFYLHIDIMKNNFKKNNDLILKLKSNHNDYAYISLTLLALWTLYYGNVLFVRQAVTTMTALYSIKFIRDKELIRFIFIIALGSTIHISLIAFVPAYWIYNLRIEYSKRVVLFLCAFIVVFFFTPTISLALSVFMNTRSRELLAMYLAGPLFSTDYTVFFTYLKGFANVFFTLILFSVIYKKHKNNLHYNGLMNLYWFGCVMYCGVAVSATVLQRVGALYQSTQILLFSFFINSFGNKTIRFVMLLMIIFYLSLRMYVSFGNYWDSYIPFRTIFSK